MSEVIRRSNIEILSDSKRAFERIIYLIENSRESIFCMIFWIDMEEFASALLRSARNGVGISLITDRRSFENRNGNQFEESMKSLSVIPNSEVRVWDGRGLYHQKIIVIDGKTVIIPSFNLTSNDIKKNRDYCLLIQDSLLAKKFENEIENRFRMNSIISLSSFLSHGFTHKRRVTKRKRKRFFSVFFLLLSNIVMFLIYVRHR